MTVPEVQAELRVIADQLLAMEDRLRALHDAIQPSPNEDAMFEGRIAWDLATELRTAVECVGEDLRRAIESLERATQTTEDDLLRDFRRGRN